MKDKKIEEALVFATERHKGQYRKGRSHDEYIVHPIAVAENVKKYVGNNNQTRDLIIVGLLHDTVEDKKASLSEINDLFGDRVSLLVKELTSDKSLQKKMGKARYLTQKMNSMSDDAFTIKLCDRLNNVESLIDADEIFRKKYLNETIYILNHLDRRIRYVDLKIINDIQTTIIDMTYSTNKVKAYL